MSSKVFHSGLNTWNVVYRGDLVDTMADVECALADHAHGITVECADTSSVWITAAREPHFNVWRIHRYTCAPMVLATTTDRGINRCELVSLISAAITEHLAGE